MVCPNCTSRDTGKVGSNQWYCWNCFVMFSFDSKMRPRLTKWMWKAPCSFGSMTGGVDLCGADIDGLIVGSLLGMVAARAYGDRLFSSLFRYVRRRRRWRRRTYSRPHVYRPRGRRRLRRITDYGAALPSREAHGLLKIFPPSWYYFRRGYIRTEVMSGAGANLQAP